MRYDHIGMLPYRAFKLNAGRMTYEGGKSDAPDTPDFAAAARETAAGNLEAAKVAAAANRVNQVTPYGNLTYTKNPNGATFDEAGYNKALTAYQQALSNPQKATLGKPSGLPTWMGGTGITYGTGAVKAPVAPTKEQFMTGASPYDSYTATQTLSPAEQAKLDKNNSLSLSLLDTANTGVSGVNDYLKQGFDWSKLPEAQVNAGQTAQDAIMSRLNPQFARDEDSLRTRLINQGIRPGSTAWDNEFNNFNYGKNDAYSLAALKGIDVGQQARQQAIQEQEFGRTEGLNIVNALRTGNQVQSPNFINTPQQATTAGPDLLGAAQAQYSGDISANNAQNASSAGLFGGLANAAGTAASAYFL